MISTGATMAALVVMVLSAGAVLVFHWGDCL